MYAIMWSEHCSYKSSKVHLRQFSEKAPPSDRMLAGIGENAGVIRVSEKLAVTFKVESHNHPSFVEPHQGAATGVGGIVRDILAMGARPVAVMDPLRFGAADHEDTKRVLPGVVAGIGYGTALACANIGGELASRPVLGQPAGERALRRVLPVGRLQNKAAAGPGNVVVLIGAKTGQDSIGEVSCWPAPFDGRPEAPAQRRSATVHGEAAHRGEACLELYDATWSSASGPGRRRSHCALTETAAAAGTGMSVSLDLVPLREASMTPPEVPLESQGPVLLVVTPEPPRPVHRARWGGWAPQSAKSSPEGTAAGCIGGAARRRRRPAGPRSPTTGGARARCEGPTTSR
jgi:phosphoribosylformylglycinamidine synthase